MKPDEKYTDGAWEGLTEAEVTALSSEEYNRRLQEFHAKEQAKREQQAEEVFSRSSWNPVEHDQEVIAGILAGTIELQKPSVIHLGEGYMLYEGKIHSVAGESGVGKSMFAGQMSIEVLNAGGEVYYFDIETSYKDFMLRMHSIGYDFLSLDRFHYSTPDESIGETGVQILQSRIEASAGPVLVVVDSAGEALNLAGLDSHTEEVAAWYRGVARKMAEAGAAVLLNDHVPKNGNNGPATHAIGSQRKRASVDVQFMLVAGKRFSRTTSGYSSVIPTKDRYGHFTPGKELARMTVESGDQHTKVSFVEPPKVSENEDGSKRYTGIMEQISLRVEKKPGICKTPLRDEIPGDNNLVAKVIGKMMDEGFIGFINPANERKGIVSLKPYRQSHDPASEKYVDEQKLMEEVQEAESV